MNEDKYLSRILAYGTKVELNPDHNLKYFMTLLVEFFNDNNERGFYAVGDDDGVALYTSDDTPMMIVNVNDDLLTFKLVDTIGVLSDQDKGSQVGYMALNVVAFLISYHNSGKKPGFALRPGDVEESFETSKEDESFGIK